MISSRSIIFEKNVLREVCARLKMSKKGKQAKGQIIKKAKHLSLDPESFLQNNDSYAFFKKLNSLIHTGPTLTNVNDYRVVLKM